MCCSPQREPVCLQVPAVPPTLPPRLRCRFGVVVEKETPCGAAPQPSGTRPVGVPSCLRLERCSEFRGASPKGLRGALTAGRRPVNASGTRASCTRSKPGTEAHRGWQQRHRQAGVQREGRGVSLGSQRPWVSVTSEPNMGGNTGVWQKEAGTSHTLELRGTGPAIGGRKALLRSGSAGGIL